MIQLISFTAAYKAENGDVVLLSKYTKQELRIPKRYVMNLDGLNKFAFRKTYKPVSNTSITTTRLTKIEYNTLYVVEFPDQAKQPQLVVKDLIGLEAINSAANHVLEYEASDLKIL